MSTLFHTGDRFEIHKVVVGPMDNNVYVLRCTETGDAVLIDAANEHDRLLELCRELDVRSVLETHGHWDHIQAVPELRDAGYSVHVTAQDAAMLPSYDEILGRAPTSGERQAAIDALTEKRAGFAAGEDDFSRRGMELLSEALRTEQMRALRERVHRLGLRGESARVPDDEFEAERAFVSGLWAERFGV